MSLSALSRYHDASEPVIFLCSLSGGRNLRSKDVLSCFKVCWYKFSQASELRELRGTEHLTKQSAFSLLYSGRTRCWKGVQLSFFIYLIVAVILITPGSGEHEDFCLGLQRWFSLPPVSVCSLKGGGFHLYVQRSIFSLLSIHKSCSAQVFVCQNFKKGSEDKFPVWNYRENVHRQDYVLNIAVGSC